MSRGRTKKKEKLIKRKEVMIREKVRKWEESRKIGANVNEKVKENKDIKNSKENIRGNE